VHEAAVETECALRVQHRFELLVFDVDE